MSFQSQIERIYNKLGIARAADPKWMVFGASSHRYAMGPPLPLHEIEAFEERVGIRLPECYRSFLLHIGNGGLQPNQCAAGPYYGIYPLGADLDFLVDDPIPILKNPPGFSPDTTLEEWNTITEPLNNGEDLSDAQYDEICDGLYGGILALGTQGCTYLHALVVAGPHKGRVLNVDMEMNFPQFAFEANFLDWYERWLDEVIDGTLRTTKPTWFGYSMAGDSTHLLDLYHSSSYQKEQHDALKGLFKLEKIPVADLDRLEAIFTAGNPAHYASALAALCKYDYNRARPHLQAGLKSDSPDVMAECLRLISIYSRKELDDWTPAIIQLLPDIKKFKAFQSAISILNSARTDFPDTLEPFFDHPDFRFREKAFGFFLLNHEPGTHFELLKKGLEDAHPGVVLSAFFIVKRSREPEFLPILATIPQRFPKESKLLYEYADYLNLLGESGRPGLETLLTHETQYIADHARRILDRQAANK